MKLFNIFLTTFLFFNLLFAQESQNMTLVKSENDLMRSMAQTYPDFFTLDESSVVIRKISEYELRKILILPNDSLDDLNENIDTQNSFPKLSNAAITIEEIINIGKTIWAIVEKGKPVLNINNSWASAMPNGIAHWTQLDNWKAPRSENYSFSAKNAYGVDAIEVFYRVIYTYGGSLGEKGNFLTNVKVVPLKVSVLWGYSLDINIEVPAVFNTGSMEDPIGSLQLFITSNISTVLKTSIVGQTFFISGKGEFEDFEY